MNILLTGSSGFIGSEIKKKLKHFKLNVIDYDIAQGQDILNLLQRRQVIEEQKIDIVLHTAAEANLYIMEETEGARRGVNVNVLGTANVADVCASKNIKLIYASTMCVYGDTKITKEEDTCIPVPQELYAYTKLAGEEIIKGYSKNFNMEYIILRFATVYGPTQRKELATSIFTSQAKANKEVTVHGTGKQTRTLTHIEDIAEGCVLACLNFHKAKNQTINLTTTEEISALKMAKDIIKECNSSSQVKFIPQRKNQTFREKTTNSKAKVLLNWKPKYKWKIGIKTIISS